MLSSGTTAVVTLGAAAVIAIAATKAYSYSRVTVINEGPVAGFVSIDNGDNWVRIPAAAAATAPISVTVVVRELPVRNTPITIKRDGAVDMSGVYVFAT